MQRNLTIKENRTGKAKKKKAEDKSQESFIKSSQKSFKAKGSDPSGKQSGQEGPEDDEARYQNSILEIRQHIADLEAERGKMKQNMMRMSVDAAKKLQKTIIKIDEIKQECDVRIFDLKQEHAMIEEDLANLSTDLTATDSILSMTDLTSQPGDDTALQSISPEEETSYMD